MSAAADAIRQLLEITKDRNKNAPLWASRSSSQQTGTR
jgi:hypothetical protein